MNTQMNRSGGVVENSDAPLDLTVKKNELPRFTIGIPGDHSVTTPQYPLSSYPNTSQSGSQPRTSILRPTLTHCSFSANNLPGFTGTIPVVPMPVYRRTNSMVETLPSMSSEGEKGVFKLKTLPPYRIINQSRSSLPPYPNTNQSGGPSQNQSGGHKHVRRPTHPNTSQSGGPLPSDPNKSQSGGLSYNQSGVFKPFRNPSHPNTSHSRGSLPSRPNTSHSGGPLPSRPNTSQSGGPLPSHPNTSQSRGPLPSHPNTSQSRGPLPSHPNTSQSGSQSEISSQSVRWSHWSGGREVTSQSGGPSQNQSGGPLPSRPNPSQSGGPLPSRPNTSQSGDLLPSFSITSQSGGLLPSFSNTSQSGGPSHNQLGGFQPVSRPSHPNTSQPGGPLPPHPNKSQSGGPLPSHLNTSQSGSQPDISELQQRLTHCSFSTNDLPGYAETVPGPVHRRSNSMVETLPSISGEGENDPTGSTPAKKTVSQLKMLLKYGNFVCADCDFTFDDNNNYDLHRKKYCFLGKHPPVKVVCGAASSGGQEQSENNSATEKWKCSFCDYTNPSYNVIKGHLLKHCYVTISKPGSGAET